MSISKRIFHLASRLQTAALFSGIALSLFMIAAPSFAAHDLGRNCYTCHNIKSGQVWQGSYSIWSGLSIGMSSYFRPITCEVCHTDYGNRFQASSESHHPVAVIAGSTMNSDYDNGVQIRCRDCHNADSVSLTPNLNPDLAPSNYNDTAGNTATDGYPNHDVSVPDNLVNAGDPPHLLSMLTPPNRTVSGASTYNKVPSSNPAADYAFCLSCHDGSANTARAVNVRQDYIDKGHYFKTTGGGITAGDRIPCSDCHASHNSPTNARLFEPDNATFTGTRPSGLTFADPYAPTDTESRAICIFCHNDTAPSGAGYIAGPYVRGVEPTVAPPTISDHITYTGTPTTSKCTNCHNPHNPKVSCASCHAPGGPGPTVVWPEGNASGKSTAYGSHLSALRSDNLSVSTDWGVQCNKCHTGHAGPVRVPVPPASWSDPSGRLTGTNMAQRLGLDNYAVDNGIGLGGTATSGGTEAEICWNCHDAQTPSPVSEWGFNTKTTPVGFPVVYAAFPTQHDGTAESKNFGWIYTDNTGSTKTSDWTAGWWRDEYDNTIRRRIASVHSVSFDPAGQSSSVAVNINADNTVNRTSPVYENKAYIRCSYCHDVHDLNRAAGDASSGKPWLRGTWIGNPYPPELPPRSGYTYTTRVLSAGYAPALQNTPRGLSTAQDRGGFFIDQNSGWPTNNPAMDTLEETAGLCTLCHGTNVDTMDYYTGSTLWRTGMVNGHSNSTLGGTRANARDLFTGSRYGAGMGMQVFAPYIPTYTCEFSCDPNYPRSSYMSGYGDLSPTNLIYNSGWFNTAAVGTFTGQGGDYANWYGTGTIGGASGPGSMAHKFTCSKCHSPHATGLPALLTHNCIDPALSDFSIYGYSGTNLIANNCHRKTTAADGWHKLAPAQ